MRHTSSRGKVPRAHCGAVRAMIRARARARSSILRVTSRFSAHAPGSRLSISSLFNVRGRPSSFAISRYESPARTLHVLPKPFSAPPALYPLIDTWLRAFGPHSAVCYPLAFSVCCIRYWTLLCSTVIVYEGTNERAYERRRAAVTFNARHFQREPARSLT